MHKRVLLVDDDEDLRSAIAAGLERRGFEVYPAASCDEARAVARWWPPDAVVLDLVGAGDAVGVVRALGVPAVIASGSTEEYLAALAPKLGAVGALSKPYGVGALVDVLERLQATPA